MASIQSPSCWCLFLDVDGTLLEIAGTPDGVHVEPDLRALLDRVAASMANAVALVSGRPIRDLDCLFWPRCWPAAGVHGLERRDALGHLHGHQGADLAALQRARERLSELSDRLPGTTLEDKGLAIALHYRRVPQAERLVRGEIRAIVREIGGRVALLEGNMVIEICAEGGTKAQAVHAFLAEPPFQGRRPIFIGDDVTDAGALADVERLGGIAVAVGDRVEGTIRVAGPRDVRVLLEEISDRAVPWR